ncbi:MAG: hypothetical protein AB1298_07165 [Bacteroidota bacterium]
MPVVKTNLLSLILLLLFVNVPAQNVQIDHSKPEEVAHKFLELYFKGDWYGACKLCASEGSEDQISYMIKKLVELEDSTDESSCSFTIDSFKIDPNQNTGKCYYTKICPWSEKPKKNHLIMKKIGDKWLVEYIYRRDKFL